MASSLEILNAANIQFLRNTPLLVVAQTGVQSLASGATTITWPTPTTDTYTGWSAGAPTRYTPKVAGWYDVTGSIGWVFNATGGRSSQLSKNGTAVTQVAVGNAGGSYNSVVAVSTLIFFNGSTDYVELVSNQNSGSSLNSVVGVTSLTAQWVHV
jgi:hypothetical protein